VGASYFWAKSEYRWADEAHLFEGDGNEYVDRAEWFWSLWLFDLALCSAVYIPLALLLRIAYVAWRQRENDNA